jgi:agmatine deiminase
MPSIPKERTDVSGYEFPFEGEKHAATLFIAPFRKDVFPAEATSVFLKIIHEISAFEPVVLIANPSLPYATVRQFQLPNVTILRLPSNDSWARDTLPIFVRKEKAVAGVCFGFDGWGGLIRDFSQDNKIAKDVLLDLRIPYCLRKDLILEGGNLDSDGRGTVMTTSLLYSRNPTLSKEACEKRLVESLGIRKLLILPYGMTEDETGGHIDNIARFLGDGKIALSMPENPSDPQYEKSLADKKYFETQKDADGNPFLVLPLPLPSERKLTDEEADGLLRGNEAVQRKAGRILCQSYANFYIGEKFVIVPVFHDPADKKALDFFQNLYGETRTIIPIDARVLVIGGGSIHCISQPIPFSSEIQIEPTEEVNVKKEDC